MTGKRDEDFKGREALDEMETRLGDIASALKTAFGAVVDAAEKGVDRSGAMDFDGGRGRASFGVRVGGLNARARSAPQAGRDPAEPIRTGSGASSKPSAEPSEDDRAPLVDVYDEADAFVLTAELPGVADGDVDVQVVVGEGLVLQTTGARRFRHVAELPGGLDAGALTSRLVNGILEIRIPKSEGAQ